MDRSLEAALWGAGASSALLIGAAIGFLIDLPPRLIAAVMAFGSGVLISALAFDLMDEAFAHGGLWGSAIGFLAGATMFTVLNVALSRMGAHRRKRAAAPDPAEAADEAVAEANPLAIALGSMLDNIPESIAIGLTLIGGGAIGIVTVIAVFLSNVPEALSASAGFRRRGRSARYVFSLWGGAVLACAVASFLGYTVFSTLPDAVVAGTTAFAAGAILAMLADTMIPEAFAVAHEAAGLIAAVGFVAAFALSKAA